MSDISDSKVTDSDSFYSLKIECNYKYGGNNGKIIMTVRPMSDNLIIIDWLITWLSRFSFKNHQKFFKILGLPVYLK